MVTSKTSQFARSDAALETALGALPVPAYTCDLAGFVTWQNEASLTVVGDLRGIHYTKLVPPQELQRSREAWLAVTLSGAHRRRTGSFRAANGELVALEAIIAPMRMNGGIVGVFGIAIPVSELPERPATRTLSPRQLDVLRLLVRGRSTKEIADELNLSPETVRNHIRRLLSELGARTRLEACLVAIRNGLVPLDLD